MDKARAAGVTGSQIGQLLREGQLVKEDGSVVTKMDVCVPADPPRKVAGPFLYVLKTVYSFHF
jgi:hypothetical protein